MIIGLSAKAGCGKTTLAGHLLDMLPDGYERVAFADPLKRDAAKAFGFDSSLAYTPDGKQSMVRIDMDAWDVAGFTPPAQLMSVRDILQWYGTEVCRAVDNDYWLRRMRETLDKLGHDNVIIDDVRMENEADLVKRLGGIMVRIAPYEGFEQDKRMASHKTETALDDWGGFDVFLETRFGELEDAAAELLSIISEGRLNTSCSTRLSFNEKAQDVKRYARGFSGMKFIYLASPYCHPEPELMRRRVRVSAEVAAELMAQGHNVFSPLVHSDLIADHLPEGLRKDHDFWLPRDFQIISKCDEVAVVLLPGVNESHGVKSEIRYAESLGLPVSFITLEG